MTNKNNKNKKREKKNQPHSAHHLLLNSTKLTLYINNIYNLNIYKFAMSLVNLTDRRNQRRHNKGILTKMDMLSNDLTAK